VLDALDRTGLPGAAVARGHGRAFVLTRSLSRS